MNVVISGIFFPVTACLEYVVRAFKRRKDCNVVTIGPYTGLQIPWTKNGIAGTIMPAHYDFEPDIILQVDPFRTAPISYAESQLPFVPDLWLDVDAGFHFLGKPKNGIRASYQTDPHVLKNWYNQVIGEYQYVFCSQTPYISPGEIYLPYAADSEWHRRILGLEQLYDVSLIGNYYPNRVELMTELRRQGKRTFFDLGEAKEDAQKIYSHSIIGINWSSLQDTTARVFELMGLGVVPIINRVPDLSRHFIENEHYLGFDNQAEAIGKINMVLENPPLFDSLRDKAMSLVLGAHTWDDRVQTLLETTKFIN